MKIFRMVLLASLLAIPAQAQNHNLADRVEELEAARSADFVNFSGQLRSQFFNVVQDGAMVDLYRLRAALGVNADISADLKFYTRFAMSKSFNTFSRENVTDNTVVNDIWSTSRFDGPTVKMERAYVDYFPYKNLAISIGRLPTLEGPPLHYLDRLPRQSTYPMLSYNAELDGLALTYNMSDWVPQDHGFVFRTVYTPFTHIAYPARGSLPLADPSGLNGTRGSVDFTIAAMLEYGIDNLGFVSRWQTILQFITIQGATFENVTQPIVTAIPGTFTNQSVMTFPNDFGDYYALSLDNEFSNIGGFGLDLYLSLLGTAVKTNNLMALTLGATPTFLGWKSDGLGSRYGVGGLLSLRQTLPVNFLKNPDLGFEYITGSKYVLFVNATGTTEEPTNFYGTVGHGFHLYYRQPLTGNLSFRLGLRYRTLKFQNDSNKLGLGDPVATNTTTRAIYGNVLFAF